MLCKPLTVAALLLAGSALAQQPTSAPVDLSAAAKPSVQQLTPVTPVLGIQSGTRLPAECGGEILPTDLSLRLKALEICTADLEQRNKLEEKLAALRKSNDSSSAAGIKLPPIESIAHLSARPNPEGKLVVRDEGDMGISTDVGQRRASAATASSGNAIPDISSLSELTLIGGGCGDVCVGMFRLGDKTVSVQRIGEPIALNAQVTAISGKGANITVTVTLRKPGMAPATKEFRL